ncbi:hypothetical protein [Acholeplasma granularum]|uniref:hypothetical protein n=1 Tax=Acholeplasma granularum TaxID=264635 RepID=UPI00046EEBDA|nr:hypothetical protein [Acholeplasma granularum]
MKIVLSYTLLLLLSLIYLILTPINKNVYETFIFDQESINYSHSTGINHDISTLSKQTIYDYQLKSFIQSYTSSFYIPKSANYYPGLFERSWAEYFKLDYQKDPLIDLNAHLFKGDDDLYYLIINYQSNNHFNGIEYLMTLHRDTLPLEVIVNKSLLVYKNKSYQTNDPFIYQSNNSFLYKETHIKNNLINPSLDGILLLKIDESSLNYLEIIIDFYELNQTNYDASLGLNKFVSENQIKYIPQSLKLIYKENQ